MAYRRGIYRTAKAEPEKVIYKIVVSNYAQHQLETAVSYYEEQSIGLGLRFITEVEHVYTKLRSNPQHYSFISSRSKKFRDVKMDSFPYVLVFEIGKKEVIIHSIFNTHQHLSKRFHKSLYS